MAAMNTTLADVEVFEAGPQTASDGTAREWTEAELDEMVRNFAATGDTVPAVVGHPKDDAPAYGWVSSLRRAGKRLIASFRDVAPEFAEMVSAKRFPNRSIKVLKTGQGWQVGHVGWLGAAAPAVSGLKPVNFTAADDVGEAHLFVAPLQPEPPMTKTFTQADIDAAAERARSEASAQHTAELAELRQAKDKAEFAQRLADCREVIAKAAQRGDQVHLTPAQAEGLAEFRAQLLGLESKEFTFAAADKTEKKVTLVAHFDAFLDSLPAQMTLGQQQATEDPDAIDAAQFAAPTGYTVSAERATLHNKALAYQAAHPNTDYLTAVRAVS